MGVVCVSPADHWLGTLGSGVTEYLRPQDLGRRISLVTKVWRYASDVPGAVQTEA